MSPMRGGLPMEDGTARVPPWILVVTGVGLQGALEDGLRRRIALIYGPPVPVVVRRYGVLRSGTPFRWCQRAALRRLAVQMRSQAAGGGPGPSGPPDVIAHSFGAWLIGHLLLANPDLRVGRVIL